MKLAGQQIHEAFRADEQWAQGWTDLPEAARTGYDRVAARLNEACASPEDRYIDEILRTCVAEDDSERLVLGALGLAGEAGEVIDLVKKARFQGHPIDWEKVKGELGDVMWYVGLLCHTLGLSLEEIRQANVEKMHRRYPDGFEIERSVNREAEKEL